MCIRDSQYTFLDEYSRFRYLEAFQEHNSYSSTVFLRHVVEKFPYAIECVQTDHGPIDFNPNIFGTYEEVDNNYDAEKLLTPAAPI